MKNAKYFKTTLILVALTTGYTLAQNPIIRDQFTADPTARVFNNKVYLFPSHDIKAPESFARKDWFCMEDYHVFSSDNLTDWTDHGVIVKQDKVDWVNASSFSMWAPDCVEKDGKYYFYFPANVKASYGRGFGIGVAIAEDPAGPYKAQPEPIKNVHGIDPCVFIDKDGRAYIYYSLNRIFAARLKDNMLDLETDPVVLGDLPAKGLIEGPFVFERNGIYYLTYPHVQNRTERLEYAISDNPLGPFKVTGVIMDESASGCWTNHHSIVNFKDQWYLFYHDKDLSPEFDKNRSVRIDSLFFNDDGTIRKVIPTLRGVGLTDATKEIEPDRYSSISATGAKVEFTDPLNRFAGWKVILNSPGSWVQYNSVSFGDRKLRSVRFRALSQGGGNIKILLDKPDGQAIGEINIPAGKEWQTTNFRLRKFKPGIHNLVLVSGKNGPVEIDWIQFVK